MIQASNIKHFYGTDKILDNINLTINTNDFMILSGESGSGKTTLLSILSTLLQPTKGEVIFDNKTITNLDSFRNKQVGFIFQFHYLISHLTVLENIQLATSKSSKDIFTMLDKLSILDCKHKYPHQISGGQRQRVAIIRAIINNPKYIFADEPTGNLDSKNSKIIFEILRNLNATIIVATHDKSLIKKDDKVILLQDGHIC